MNFDQVDAVTGSLSEFAFSPNVLWGVLSVALLIFSVISIVLVYHWTRYGRKNVHIAFAEIVYFPVALLFIALAVFSIIMYGNVS